MKDLLYVMEKCQEVNIAQDGVSFTKDSFTRLYEEVAKCAERHMDEKDIAGRNGIIIGAVASGLLFTSYTLGKKLLKKKSRTLTTNGKKVEIDLDLVKEMVRASTEVEKAKLND